MQKNINARNLAIALQSAAAAFLADQILKQLLFTKVELMNGSWIFGLIRFTDHRNFGISFNLPVPFWLMILIAVLALGWSIRELLRLTPETEKKRVIFLGLFIGGVLGNVYDRVALGYVRDWLLLWGRTAVNLADGFILAGLFGYLWGKDES